ncbi:restriction endonuclease subunit S [Klebsiella michiganensis]|nr:restriction endonuclease subunit S [Klebsiella michiganensis]
MNENKLPREWVNTKLGNIVDYGRSAKKTLVDVTENTWVLELEDIEKDSSKLLSKVRVTERPFKSTKNCFNKGDVLYGKLRPYLNKVIMADDEGGCTTEIIPINAEPFCINKYIFFWLKSPFFLRCVNEVSYGVNMPRLGTNDGRNAPFYLAPLAEQKIISNKLGSLWARVESIKSRLENIPELLKKFRHSVLLSAVSGKLTAEWRNENKTSESAKELVVRWISLRKERFSIYQNELLALGDLKRTKKFIEPHLPDIETGGELVVPPSWEIVSVSQIADCLDSQRIPVKKEKRIKSEGLYPYFGANGEVDRVDDFIFNGDYVLVTEDETFYGRVKPIAYRYTGKCWVNNHVHILSAPTKSANDYLCYALMYYKIIPWLTGTTGRAKLTQAALNVLPIGLPPEKEIEEIVLRIDQFLSYADSIQRAANNALARINNLTQSILAKAFCGELTAQWREENLDLISGINSAEALLQKISTEKLASGTSKKIVKKVVR